MSGVNDLACARYAAGLRVISGAKHDTVLRFEQQNLMLDVVACHHEAQPG